MFFSYTLFKYNVYIKRSKHTQSLALLQWIEVSAR